MSEYYFKILEVGDNVRRPDDLVKVQKCQTMDQKFVIMPENRPRKFKNVRKKIKKV